MPLKTPLLGCLGMTTRSKIKYVQNFTDKQCGAVEACWAHNPEVVGPKPTTAKRVFGINQVCFKMERLAPNIFMLVMMILLVKNEVCSVPILKRKHLWVALAFCGYKKKASKKVSLLPPCRQFTPGFPMGQTDAFCVASACFWLLLAANSDI